MPTLPIFIARYEQLSECSHVEWSAYLTSHCRRQLLDFAAGQDDLVYCDTDSLYCERPRVLRIGAALGEWKEEGEYRDFEALAPKTYRYTDADGRKHGASKGIPNAVENFDRLRDGVTVDTGVDTFKTGLKKGDLFARRSMTRAVRGDGIHFGDRTLGADGRTHPPTARKLAEDLWELS